MEEPFRGLSDQVGRICWNINLGLSGNRLKIVVFDFHTDAAGFFVCFSQAGCNTFCKGVQDRYSLAFFCQVGGQSGRVSNPFCLRRGGTDRAVIDAICVIPEHGSMAFQIERDQFRVGGSKFSDGADAEVVQSFHGRFACHEQFSDRKRPHFLRDFVWKQSVYFIRLFKIRCHFCQKFIGRNTDIYGKAKAAVDFVLDVSGSGVR